MIGKVRGTIAKAVGVLVALVFVLAGAQAVPAAYIGPIRASGPDVRDPSGDYIVLNKTGGPGGVSVCTLDTNCGTDPSPEQQHYWCGGGALYPDGWCGTHPGSCWTGTVVTRYCHYEPGPDEPPATVSGSASCATPGTNGWCRGGPSVAFTANDPLGSYVITWLEGNRGGADFQLCNPTDAKTVNCSWAAEDGEYSLNYWAHSSKGDTSSMASLGMKVDVTNPTGSVTINRVANAAGWVKEPVTVTTTGADTISGVAARLVQVNGGAAQASPVVVGTDGLYTVNGVVRDNAGNQIGTSSIAFKLDMTPPTITVVPDRVPDGPGGWYMGPVTVDVTGTDNLSGYSHTDYQLLSGGTWTNGTMPVTITSEGVNTLGLTGFDVAGSNVATSTLIRIDLTAPNAGLAINGTIGNNGWYVSPVDLLVNASDSGSGVCSRSLSVDAGAWGPAPLNGYLGQGTHSFVGQSQDCVGRDSAVTSALSFKVDTEKPSISSTTPGPDGIAGWYITPFELSVTGSDETSGLALAQSRISGGTWDSNPVLVDIEGMFNVEYRTVDNAGNEMLSVAGVKVDLSDPSLSLSETGTLGDNGWYVSPVVVDAAASDAISGLRSLQMSLNESAWATTASLTLSTDGEHQVDARATDRASRTTEDGVEVRIDQTPPTMSPTITGTMGNNNWYVTPVTLKANAADATSGLASVLPEAETVVEDTASFTPEWTVRDNAGHEINRVLDPIKVDATAPAIGFDPEDDILIGIVTLSGRARDALSGLVKVDVSVNGGVTWTEVAVNPDGTWEMPFNTLLFPGGDRLVRARAEDEAGNVTVVDMNTVIGNKEPQIDISDRWLVWEDGILEIKIGDTGYEGVKVGVCDYEKRWRCVEWEYKKGEEPSKVTWDGYFGKVYAPAGEYRVWATIWDAYGRSNMDQGTIIIPPPSTGTPTATMTPTVTPTPTQTKTGTVEPEPTQVAETPAATITAQPTATPFVPVPVKPNIPVKLMNIGPYLVLIGFCFALGASVSRDRRPREWRRLAEQLSKMNNIQKKKGE